MPELDGRTPESAIAEHNGVPRVSDIRAQLKSIYDDYRTALFNFRYYQERVSTLDRWRLGFDISIALFASSSPVAGWALWKSDSMKNAWAILAGLGAVLAIVGPLLKLTEKLKTASELKAGYCLVYFDLREIARSISANKALSADDLQLYKATDKRMRELTAKDDSTPSRATKTRLQSGVNATIPANTLWVPRRS